MTGWLLTLAPSGFWNRSSLFIPENERSFLLNKKSTTSFLQKFPMARKKYRSYLPLMPLAVEQFDLSGYDLVISVSHAVAKGVITGPDQLHIAYVNSPIRYAWDLMHQYLDEADLKTGPKSWLARVILHYIRNWDVRSSNTVDEFIGNSEFIASRIRKFYRREATAIYPPVDIETYTLKEEKENFYLTASRMVPYKKMGMIVEAFNQMPDKELIVIGDGPELEKIKSVAKSNIVLLGYQPTPVLKDYMQRAKAFVFAAQEDFGITPLEAQACGTPVIAFGRGGSLETVVENETGLFFREQTPESLIAAVIKFEKRTNFNPKIIRSNALRFSVDNFRRNFRSFVDTAIENFKRTKGHLIDPGQILDDKIIERRTPVRF